MLNTLFSFAIVMLCLSSSLFGIDNSTMPDLPGVKDPSALLDNQIVLLDHLTQMTKQSLDQQIDLREQIIQYKHIQEAYLKDTQDNELLFQLIKSGYKVLHSIKESHLVQNFDPDFINELTLFYNIATKRGIPKP